MILYVSVPSRPLPDVVPTITPNRLTIVWDPLDCILRNGELLGYVVEFAPLSSMERRREDVRFEEYIANNLNPGVNYTFRFAAVNNFGVGPFSQLFIISTQETGKLALYIARQHHHSCQS